MKQIEALVHGGSAVGFIVEFVVGFIVRLAIHSSDSTTKACIFAAILEPGAIFIATARALASKVVHAAAVAVVGTWRRWGRRATEKSTVRLKRIQPAGEALVEAWRPEEEELFSRIGLSSTPSILIRASAVERAKALPSPGTATTFASASYSAASGSSRGVSGGGGGRGGGVGRGLGGRGHGGRGGRGVGCRGDGVRGGGGRGCRAFGSNIND